MVFFLGFKRYLKFYNNIFLLSRRKRNLAFDTLRRRSLRFFFKIRKRLSTSFFYFFYFFSLNLSFFYSSCCISLNTPTIKFFINISLSASQRFFNNLLLIANVVFFYFFSSTPPCFLSLQFSLDSSFYALYRDISFLFNYWSSIYIHSDNIQFLLTNFRPSIFNVYSKPFYIYFNYLITKYISLLANAPITLCVLNKPTSLLSLSDITFFLYFFKVCRVSQFALRSIFKPHDFFGLVFFTFRWFDFTWLLRRIQAILNLISIFRHKSFWNYFFLLLQRYIYVYFCEQHLSGIYVSLKGKIGVVGNSRKRRLFWQIGKSSPSQFCKTIHYTQTFFYTSTGAIGFRIWILR